jgi:hypothetical protein
MKWHCQKYLLALPLLFLPSLTHAAPHKLPAPGSSAIIRFTLFNYDNLIADHYENTTLYSQQLAHLLQTYTNCPPDTIQSILSNRQIHKESQPVRYMMAINAETKALCGYYFLDD